MKNRLISIVLLVMLSLGMAGIDRPSPALAESSLAAGIPNAPNASLLPDDTVLYFDFRISDLQKTLDLFSGLAQKISGTRSDNIFSGIDNEFSRYLGRDVSFA